MEQKQKIRSLYDSALAKYNCVAQNLDKIMIESGEHPEGNCFHIDGRVFEIARTFRSKRYNLFHEAMTAVNIMEIGFNGGHSCLLFLLANQYSRIQIFDLGNHSYARECYNFLNAIFPNRINVVWGNSLDTLVNFQSDMKYDLIHIDGGHGVDVLRSDIFQCKRFATTHTRMFIDDISYHPAHANKELTSDVVDKIVSGELIEILPLFQCPYHVLVQYNMEYRDNGKKCEHGFAERD